MKRNNFGRHVVLEHGLISNILSALSLIDQLTISNICSRTHDKTVPWNIFCVEWPQDMPNVFPKIDAISDLFVCKRIEAKIEGETGYFYGSVSNTTGYPEGYGVYTTEDWVHCGKVEHGHFKDGRKVSVSPK